MTSVARPLPTDVYSKVPEMPGSFDALSRRCTRAFCLLTFAMAYWQVVCWSQSVAEPWDAELFWVLWYPLSIVVAVIGAVGARGHRSDPGIVVAVAQGLTMWINGLGESSWPFALATLAILAAPAIAASVAVVHALSAASASRRGRSS